jgi:hypothetical protein
MPVPDTCAPAACASVSGAATVMLALRAGQPAGPSMSPREVETTTAVSRLAPLSIVMVWLAVKSITLATEMTVAPASTAASTVVAPAVPTAAKTAVSGFAPASIRIVWPAPKSATLAALRLSAPAADAADRVVAACVRESVQRLSASKPSGKRPTLLLVAPAAGDTNTKVANAAGFTKRSQVTIDTGTGIEARTVAAGGVGAAGWVLALAVPAAAGAMNTKVTNVCGGFGGGIGGAVST